MDGFGAFFGDEHAQVVKGCTTYSIRQVFCDHLYSFLLNGINSISLDGDVLNIMNVSGKKICKGNMQRDGYKSYFSSNQYALYFS